MAKSLVNRYDVVIRCTYYTKYNQVRPIYHGHFEYDVTEEFIGGESSAVDHFAGKYNKTLSGRYAETVYQVVGVYRVIMEVN